MPSFVTNTPAAAEFTVLKAGEYPFIVVNAIEKVSKTGNPMIELKLRVDDAATVFDYLVFSEKSFWKVDQFLKSTGQHPGPDQNISIDADDCVGQKGTVKIRVGKTDKGLDRNEVESYTWEEEGF